ncbi:MAG: CTP synthase [Candidatus Doudnabacteria bacterium Gr01-1014_77]|uniref:CTP synthase n=1 Tax=Candidatus Doudnabacteria bacterium Gr01-1014_77 TaxID=2017133 RepID=A0A554JDA1_9BACT|nr:MAG: CTP synthase [Candidatus Doudnabacteria bacterium Gr01-1014_77]
MTAKSKTTRAKVQKLKKHSKFIFISGGVISGIGKGITSASIGAILQSRGLNISPVKVDMYLNQDAGTIRPQEHGEVFVTDDGMETDQDLGHYERFIDRPLNKINYITTGQIYGEVLRKERAFEYEGEDVEAIPHVTDEIIRRFMMAAKNADIVLIELGGTVGEYQNAIFFEATRIMKLRHPDDILHIHVAYLPVPSYLGEMKSKPVQQSVRMLNSMGIEPDIIVGRAETVIDDKRKERIALFCNVDKKAVLSNPDVKSIYEVPVILEEQNAGDIILEKLKMKPRKRDMKEWRNFVKKIKSVKKDLNIAVVGKYFGTGKFELADSYVSVIESLKHAAWSNKANPKLTWIDSLKVENEGAKKILSGFDGIVVPGGFGKRGTEGMIQAVEYARKNKIPYLGLCYGMQMATIEYARNVAKLRNANTTEVDDETKHPVIHIMPDQEKKLLVRDYGASMRLGAWDCVLKKGSQVEALYKQRRISERHRHRYEVNNKYRGVLEKAGLVFSGTSPDGKLAEIIELPGHPFFMGSQFHPEYKSRPLRPHPLFEGFMKAVAKGKK